MTKKFLLPIFVLLAVVAGIAIIAYPSFLRNSMVEQQINSATRFATNFKTIRGYYTENVVTKVKKAGMNVDVKHKNIPNTVPIPATLIHDLSEQFKGSGLEIKLYSGFPFPNRKNRALDDFQKESWALLSKNS